MSWNLLETITRQQFFKTRSFKIFHLNSKLSIDSFFLFICFSSEPRLSAFVVSVSISVEIFKKFFRCQPSFKFQSFSNTDKDSSLTLKFFLFLVWQQTRWQSLRKPVCLFVCISICQIICYLLIRRCWYFFEEPLW